MNDNGQPAPIQLRHDSRGRLVLVDAQGVEHVGVEPVRGFPLSEPDRWISICSAEGRALLEINDLGALAPAVRQVLETDLARREFVPVIRRILSVPADTEPAEWEVETDRGYTRFLINGGDVRRLAAHRALVIDTRGIRYLIDDARALDAASRRVLEHYLHQV